LNMRQYRKNGRRLVAVFFSVIASTEVVLAYEAGIFRCTPSILSKTQVLEIYMGPTHAGELAVIAPDKEFFFIAYTLPDRQSQLRPILPSGIFKTIVAINLSPQTFVAHRWREGITKYEKVFNQPGEYTFILGDRLETDATDGVEICKVTYTDN
ncbi:MAG: hypothetical protein V3R90_02615, partial [Limibaculum sp.]